MLSTSRFFGGKPIRRPWVAEIIGKHQSKKLDRVFLCSDKDYKNSNSTGSRGVYLNFILETNRLYEVHYYTSWKNSDDYFCAVTENGDIRKLTEDEVKEWLSAF